MPTPTYTSLANITLGATATSVTFSSISNSYRDLILIFNQRGTFVSADLKFNNDSGANYSAVQMYGNGSSAFSSSWTGANANYLYSPAVEANGMVILNIMDYSATDKHKTMLTRQSTPTNHVMAYTHRWSSTAAINSLQFVAAAGSFGSGTTFALYGVSA